MRIAERSTNKRHMLWRRRCSVSFRVCVSVSVLAVRPLFSCVCVSIVRWFIFNAKICSNSEKSKCGAHIKRVPKIFLFVDSFFASHFCSRFIVHLVVATNPKIEFVNNKCNEAIWIIEKSLRVANTIGANVARAQALPGTYKYIIFSIFFSHHFTGLGGPNTRYSKSQRTITN